MVAKRFRQYIDPNCSRCRGSGKYQDPGGGNFLQDCNCWVGRQREAIEKERQEARRVAEYEVAMAEGDQKRLHDQMQAAKNASAAVWKAAVTGELDESDPRSIQVSGIIDNEYAHARSRLEPGQYISKIRILVDQASVEFVLTAEEVAEPTTVLVYPDREVPVPQSADDHEADLERLSDALEGQLAKARERAPAGKEVDYFLVNTDRLEIYIGYRNIGDPKSVIDEAHPPADPPDIIITMDDLTDESAEASESLSIDEMRRQALERRQQRGTIAPQSFEQTPKPSTVPAAVATVTINGRAEQIAFNDPVNQQRFRDVYQIPDNQWHPGQRQPEQPKSNVKKWIWAGVGVFLFGPIVIAGIGQAFGGHDSRPRYNTQNANGGVNGDAGGLPYHSDAPPTEDPADPTEEPTEILTYDENITNNKGEGVENGDCFRERAAGTATIAELKSVDCQTAHDEEVVAFLHNHGSGKPYPSTSGDDVITQECLHDVPLFRHADDVEVHVSYELPTESEWQQGHQTILCVALTYSKPYSVGDKPLLTKDSMYTTDGVRW